MTNKQFHDLIEQQDPEGKAAAWRRLEERLKAEQPEQAEAVKLVRKKTVSFWRVFSVCASAAACLAIGIGLGLGLNRGGNEIADNNPSDLGNRYCGFDDCETISAPYTLKQYAEVYGVDLLYLDWYDHTDDYDKALYQVKESGENVCYEEYFMDSDGNYVYIYVTDNKTETDFVTWYNAETGIENEINNISIYTHAQSTNTEASFEYKDYRYYLVLENEDEAYLLQIAEELLNSAK